MGRHWLVHGDAGQGCTNRCSRAPRKWRENEEIRRKWRENEEMRRKWRENEEMERDWLSTFPHSLSISSLSLYFLHQKASHFLQNVKYSTFVANISKTSTYALWGNNSGSNLLRGSSASCAGLPTTPFWGNWAKSKRTAFFPWVRPLCYICFVSALLSKVSIQWQINNKNGWGTNTLLPPQADKNASIKKLR